MQIDWITVAAQIVNFLVLVWLLQRFLYGPITRAMARREARIETRLREARDSRAEAEAEAAELREAREALERSRDETLDRVREEAAALRARLEEEAREAVAEKRAAWRERLDAERAEFEDRLRLQMTRQVFETTRKTLRALADAELAGQVAERLADRLENLDDQARADLAGAGDVAVIESGLELPPEAKARLTRAVHRVISDGIDTEYRVNEDLLLGARLRLGTHTVEWSADLYLEGLQAAVEAALDDRRARTAA